MNRIISTPDTGSDCATGGTGRDNVVSRKSVNDTDRKGQMAFQRRCAGQRAEPGRTREQSDGTGNGSTQSEKLVQEGRAVGRVGGAKEMATARMQQVKQNQRK